jgi:hypothetical protein
MFSIERGVKRVADVRFLDHSNIGEPMRQTMTQPSHHLGTQTVAYLLSSFEFLCNKGCCWGKQRETAVSPQPNTKEYLNEGQNCMRSQSDAHNGLVRAITVKSSPPTVNTSGQII